MTALASINLSYIGAPGTTPVGGQEIVNYNGGPAAKTLYAYGQIVNNSTASATNMPVNFIDGTQTFGTSLRLALVSAAAAVGSNTTYTTYGPTGQFVKDTVVTISGFTNSGNNVTNVKVVSTASQSITVVNSGGVAETNPAGTLVGTIGGTPAWVNVFIAGSTGDSAAAVVLAAAVPPYPTAITATGFTLNFPTLTTSGATVTFGAIIAFSS